MRSFVPAILILFALVVPATAQNAPPERAQARYPAGWVAGTPFHEGNITVVRLLPPGQSDKDFVEAILIERYEAERRPAKEHVLSRAEATRRSCDGVLVSQVNESQINGYAAAQIRFTCTRSQRNGKSGAMMVIAIEGRDALHVISRFWVGQGVAANQLVPVPQQTIAEWDAFAQTVTVCDTRDSKHPCPMVAH